jgi:hypothetical protein
MALLESIAAATLIAGANYADLHSTQRALSHGAVETNGLAGPSGQRLSAVKLGAVAMETGVFLALNKKHKKLAWTWVATLVAGNLVIAHHNNKVANQLKGAGR